MVLCLDPENEDLLAFETMLDGEVEVQGPEGAAAPTFAPPWVTEIKALQPQPLSPKTATRSIRRQDAVCCPVSYWPRLAWACSDFAKMLLDRDEPGDREKAIELQDEALTITQELGIRPLTERIRAWREILPA